MGLPKAAYADWQASGREMLVIKRAYRYFVGKAVVSFAQDQLAHHMAFPSGQPTPATQPPAHSQQTRKGRHQ